VRDAERDGNQYIPFVSNIFVENVDAKEALEGWYLNGWSQKPIKHIYIRDWKIQHVTTGVFQYAVEDFNQSNIQIIDKSKVRSNQPELK
jgi:hypothetical protein